MRILLTGSDGQIGWELKPLLGVFAEVAAPDRTKLDLADEDLTRAFIRESRPDLIINAAAYTAVDRAEQEPDLAYAINAKGPLVLAEEARRLKASLLHFSTDYVFDGSNTVPYAPGDEPHPVSIYGRTKLAGEQAIVSMAPDHLILRTCWVYGGRRSNFLMTMLRLAATRPELRVVNDQYGSPSWCRALARATASIIACRMKRAGRDFRFDTDGGLLHLSCAGQATWFEFARQIIELAQIAPKPAVVPITRDEYQTPARRPAYSVLDCSETCRRFNIVLPDWKHALHEAMAEINAATATLSH